MRKEIQIRKSYNVSNPKKERINIKISEKDLESLDSLAKKRGMNRSELIRNLVKKEDNKFSRPFSTYKCDKCGKKIKIGEEYYAEVGSIERQYKEDDKTIVEVIEGKDLGILCYSCAEKSKAIDYIKTGNPEYPLTIVKETNREVWEE